MFASFNPGHVGIPVELREGLAMAERHGFSGFDAQLEQLHGEVAAHGAAATRDLFARHGLRPGCWNLPFMPYQVSDDEWRAWLDRLPPLLASARDAGARRAGMWVFSGSDERAYEENFAFHVARFTPIARLLADHGIRLGLEFIGPETTQRRFRHRFIRSIRETFELAAAIGPNCGQLIDAWHWYAVGGTRDDLRGLRREQLVHIHVDDAPEGVPLAALQDDRRRLPCTTGVIDIAGFMEALADAGYDGPVTAEPFDPEVAALPAEQAAAITAKTTRHAVALANQAH